MTSRQKTLLGKRRRDYTTKKKKPLEASGPLSVGVQGILVSGNKKHLCMTEAHDVLSKYADLLYGPEEPCTTTSRSVENRRFTFLNTGTKHLMFLRCSAEINPAELVHTVLNDAYSAKFKETMFCQRILPVERVCHASLADIAKCAETVLEPHFHRNKTDTHTFAVRYKARHNDKIQKDHVIDLLASQVTQEDKYPHVVDFNDPELVIIVEVIKNLCCLSVIKDFNKLKKYNIHLLTEQLSEQKGPVAETMKGSNEKKASSPSCGTVFITELEKEDALATVSEEQRTGLMVVSDEAKHYPSRDRKTVDKFELKGR